MPNFRCTNGAQGLRLVALAALMCIMGDFRLTRMLAQPSNVPSAQEAYLVLASGGVDSSTILWLAAQQGLNPSALFLDYGQPAAGAEAEAVTRICRGLGVSLRRVQFVSTAFGAGEIRGRNAFLLHVALLEFPASSGVVALGIHAGTGYADCSPEFMEVIEHSYAFHTGGAITPVAPFLHWSKQDVYSVATKLDLPLAQTYSCEAANHPCGRCRSCLDRRLLVPGTMEC